MTSFQTQSLCFWLRYSTLARLRYEIAGAQSILDDSRTDSVFWTTSLVITFRQLDVCCELGGYFA